MLNADIKSRDTGNSFRDADDGCIRTALADVAAWRRPLTDLRIDHKFVRALTKRLRARFAPAAKHTEVLEEIARALGQRPDALMHMLKREEPLAQERPIPQEQPTEDGSEAGAEPETRAEKWERMRALARAAKVDVSDSVRIDGIVCLIDGVKKKMLPRYLRGMYGLEPEEYREIFDLPAEYPLVAPGFSAEKRIVATSQRLDAIASGSADRFASVPADLVKAILAADAWRTPVAETLGDSHILCLIDGLKVASLTRHLSERYNLRPGTYRWIFGLPDDYPMEASGRKG